MEPVKKNSRKRSLIFALVWSLTFCGAVFILKHGDFTKPVALAIAVVPIIVFIIYIYTYIKAMSMLDEVRQRVLLEAVVIAFSLNLLLQITLFLLSLCDITNFDWFGYPEMVLYCIFFYFVGLFVSSKKYSA